MGYPNIFPKPPLSSSANWDLTISYDTVIIKIENTIAIIASIPINTFR